MRRLLFAVAYEAESDADHSYAVITADSMAESLGTTAFVHYRGTTTIITPFNDATGRSISKRQEDSEAFRERAARAFKLMADPSS